MKNQLPNTQTTLSYYDNHTQEFIQSTRDVSFQNIQDKFLSYLKKDASILDFGCGSGRDTKFIPFGQVRNFIEKEIKGKLFIKS